MAPTLIASRIAALRGGVNDFGRPGGIDMNRSIPCVLMRAGTSRGPFFLREWLPQGTRRGIRHSSVPWVLPIRCSSTV